MGADMKSLASFLVLLLFAPGLYADTVVYVSLAAAKKIAVYRMNPEDGALTRIGETALEGEPAALIVDPQRRFLFASLRAEGKLSAFRIDAKTGQLTHINTVEAGLDPAHLSTDREGRYLFAAYYVAAKVTVHRIGKDGSLSAMPHQSIPTVEKAHAILLDPSNRFAFVPHTGPNTIFQFTFDAKLGELKPSTVAKLATGANTGPRHIVFHPTKNIAYVDNEQGGSVTAYALDTQAGTLQPFQTLSTLPKDFKGDNACAEIKIHPSGKFLYTANRGHDSIAGFKIDAQDGKLTSNGQTPTEKTPRSFDLDPDGRFLYAAGESADKIAAYRIDANSGELQRFATYDVGRQPWWVMTVRLPYPDAKALQNIAQVAAEAKLSKGKFDESTSEQLKSLAAGLTDAQVRRDMEQLLPAFEEAANRTARDRVLLAEIKRLGGTATVEVAAPAWLRAITGDQALPIFGRLVEIELNERSDGHKEPVPKKLSDRVTDDWLKNLAGQDQLRRLEVSGTAVTSDGLVHLKELRNLERLNICLTAVDDRGFEHLAGMTKMKRMVVCSSKITGSGFKYLSGMTQIESINLHSAPASDTGLAAIGKLTNLRRLEIVHTNVTDAGLKYLAGLHQLQQLHIDGPEATASALPFLGQLKELYELDVYNRAASNQTMEQIGKLPKLRLLMLVNGTFDDDSLKHLAKLSTLESLSLNSSKMTEAAIEHLGRLKSLRKLHVGGTRISPAGKKRLQEMLPKAEITP
jgi:6-phosphogluconolactonase